MKCNVKSNNSQLNCHRFSQFEKSSLITLSKPCNCILKGIMQRRNGLYRFCNELVYLTLRAILKHAKKLKKSRCVISKITVRDFKNLGAWFGQLTHRDFSNHAPTISRLCKSTRKTTLRCKRISQYIQIDNI